MTDNPFSYDECTRDLRKTFGLARVESGRFRHSYCGPEHVLIAFAKKWEGPAKDVLETYFKVDSRSLRFAVENNLLPASNSYKDWIPTVMTQLNEVGIQARKYASSVNDTKINDHHILYGISQVDNEVVPKVWHELTINPEELRAAIARYSRIMSEHLFF